MKRKFEWGAIVFTVCIIFIIRFGFLEGPSRFVYLDIFSKSLRTNISRHHEKDPYDTTKHSEDNAIQQHSRPPTQMPLVLASNLSSLRPSLGAWSGLKRMLNRSDLPVQVLESFKEGLLAWESLLPFVNERGYENRKDDKQCPDSVRSTDAEDQAVALPCGLILDSSITVLATPTLGSTGFQIDLIGVNPPGHSGRPPIIFHYNVRLQGDKLTENAAIIQNTWAWTSEWGEEERCPSSAELKPSQVDGLDRCIEKIGTIPAWKPSTVKDAVNNSWHSIYSGSEKAKPWFPFVEGMPFAATIWAGWEGFHVTVNGKHISSFQYHEGYEPASVAKVEVQGGLRLQSIFATGLPMSDLTSLPGLEDLRAPPFPPKSQKVALFIGVFSSPSNFDRRIAQRKSWMQYDAVRAGDVVVRFFVGLHAQEQVNKELWEEAKTFGDIQLLPFVDYYHLITLKTAAICIFVTKHLTADYVMKTDDDTFVRVDIVLSLIQNMDLDISSLLGEVEMISSPSRDPTSKWYITHEPKQRGVFPVMQYSAVELESKGAWHWLYEKEWAEEKFPPWAHGPGYVFSSDIANFVSRFSASSQLQLFKLEDVSMGIWIDEYQRSQNKPVLYVHNSKFVSQGCEADYVTAHYQTPRQMLCLWDKLQRTSQAVCCA